MSMCPPPMLPTLSGRPSLPLLRPSLSLMVPSLPLLPLVLISAPLVLPTPLVLAANVTRRRLTICDAR